MFSTTLPGEVITTWAVFTGLLVVALAAVTPGRLPAWTAALSAAWLGVESIIYPRLPASLGVTGGVLTVVWALLVLIAAELARRRTLKAGDVFYVPAGVVHDGKNVGSGPAKVLATYVV